jgi:hypothetical protein
MRARVAAQGIEDWHLSCISAKTLAPDTIRGKSEFAFNTTRNPLKPAANFFEFLD